VTVFGTGIGFGAVVSFGGATVPAEFDHDGTISLRTPPHPAGRVDVVVTNRDGMSGSAAGAFLYVSPGSFDPNGAWFAETFDGSHSAVSFTIENDALVRAACLPGAGGVVRLSLAVPAPVVDGEFSIEGPDGIAMTGRMVSASQIVGTMNLSPCAQISWRAVRSGQP
jgi:hypothetical protein